MNIEEQILAQQNAIRAKRGDIMFDDDSDDDDGMGDDDFGGDTEDEEMDDIPMTAPPVKLGEWTPGTFLFIFYYMGQGDCTLIVCPDQKLIMIDCGSSKLFPENTANLIRNDVKLYSQSGSPLIDFLIFTHEDRDHYNKLAQVFDPKKFGGILKIGYLLFSDKKSLTDPIGFYDTSSKKPTKSFLLSKVRPTTLNEVNINQNSKYVVSWINQHDEYPAYSNYANGYQQNLSDPILNLASGSGENAWSVDIICGNVGDKSKKKDAKLINSFSICTLFTRQNKKVLLVGDATDITTAYLMQSTVKNSIDNLDFANIAHHGSSNDSSANNYVNWTRPKTAIDSVQYMESGYHLPRQVTTQKYLNISQASVQNHNIDSWIQDTRVDKTNKNYCQKLYDSNKSAYKAKNKSTYILKNINDNTTGPILISPKSGFYLDRQKYTNNVINTGQMSTLSSTYTL